MPTRVVKLCRQGCSSRSHDADLVGNLEGIALLSEDDEGLLLAAGGDHGVDLANLDVVEVLAGLSDLGLGGSLVHDEHEGVVVLSDLDGGLGAAGELDDRKLVVGVFLLVGVRDGLGATLHLQGSGASEGDLGPSVGLLGVVSTLLNLLASVLSLQLR